MRSAPYIWGGAAIGLGLVIALEYRRRGNLGRLRPLGAIGGALEELTERFPTLADYVPGQFAKKEQGGNNENPPD